MSGCGIEYIGRKNPTGVFIRGKVIACVRNDGVFMQYESVSGLTGRKQPPLPLDYKIPEGLDLNKLT